MLFKQTQDVFAAFANTRRMVGEIQGNRRGSLTFGNPLPGRTLFCRATSPTCHLFRSAAIPFRQIEAAFVHSGCGRKINIEVHYWRDSLRIGPEGRRNPDRRPIRLDGRGGIFQSRSARLRAED